MDKKTFAIAIDGPVAAGKGTIALQVAHALGGFYLYTGAMYRSLTLFCLDNNIDLGDPQAVTNALSGITIAFQQERVLLNDTDVTDRIKAQDVANGASLIATYPSVRSEMVGKQQHIAQNALSYGKIVVSEGRDTGTKVFPDAPLKVYLTASQEIRAKRRLAQFIDQGRDVRFEEILEEIADRDKRDTQRQIAPLPSNPAQLGYFILDNSTMNEEQTVQAILNELKRRQLV